MIQDNAYRGSLLRNHENLDIDDSDLDGVEDTDDDDDMLPCFRLRIMWHYRIEGNPC